MKAMQAPPNDLDVADGSFEQFGLRPGLLP